MFSEVDRTIQQFVEALAARDQVAVLATLASDALLHHRGKAYQHAKLTRRVARLLSLRGLAIEVEAARVKRPADGSQIALVLRLGPKRAGLGAARRTAPPMSLRGARTVGPHADPAGARRLPAPVAAFIGASNGADLEQLLSTFADDALVNDQLCEYWGKPAIAAWAARDIIGERLSIKVVKSVAHYGSTMITAHVDGNYDKRGLPEPLVLTFYFSTWGDKIVQLLILRNIAEL